MRQPGRIYCRSNWTGPIRIGMAANFRRLLMLHRRRSDRRPPMVRAIDEAMGNLCRVAMRPTFQDERNV